MSKHQRKKRKHKRVEQKRQQQDQEKLEQEGEQEEEEEEEEQDQDQDEDEDESEDEDEEQEEDEEQGRGRRQREGQRRSQRRAQKEETQTLLTSNSGSSNPWKKISKIGSMVSPNGKVPGFFQSAFNEIGSGLTLGKLWMILVVVICVLKSLYDIRDSHKHSNNRANYSSWSELAGAIVGAPLFFLVDYYLFPPVNTIVGSTLFILGGVSAAVDLVSVGAGCCSKTEDGDESKVTEYSGPVNA